MRRRLDDLDLKIIHNLQRDGRVSVTALSDRVGSSRPTVTLRLKRLLDEGLVTIRGGLNIRKLGFKMACVGLEVRNDDTRREVERVLKRCPRVLSLSRTPEKANIHVNMWGEDGQTINSTIESFRDISNVDIVYTHYLETPIHGDITIDVEPSEGIETPCGRTCSVCYRYNNSWCLGCPVTADYKNPLLE
ncbi:MAG: Lrp/AsnC family transcriptional regulator [Candidatus Bathyarchaeia archaeon]